MHEQFDASLRTPNLVFMNACTFLFTPICRCLMYQSRKNEIQLQLVVDYIQGDMPL